jgi:hypothetical protein
MKPETHQLRAEFCQHFERLWQDELGAYFETPEHNWIYQWFRLCGWDWDTLVEAVTDLTGRCDRPFASYEHGMRQFSSTLIRLTKEKHGRVNPLCEDRRVTA